MAVRVAYVSIFFQLSRVEFIFSEKNVIFLFNGLIAQSLRPTVNIIYTLYLSRQYVITHLCRVHQQCNANMVSKEGNDSLRFPALLYLPVVCC